MGKLQRAIGRLLHAPKVAVEPPANLETLGSGYGGWTFRADEALNRATIVSAGLGEDASFDVEFARRFGARVILVDPTPRAIAHYSAIAARLGEPSTCEYEAGGSQPAEAYPLDDVTNDQLVLVPKALWTETTTLKFYKPPDPSHVSHSISDFQNDYARDGDAIEVESTTLAALLTEFGIAELQLLKLDIEAAEIAVLDDMLDRGLRPVQLLVEFDELMLRTKQALENWQRIDAGLREAGYSCGHFDGRSCFLYTLPA